MGYVPSSAITPLLNNTTSGVAADPDAMDNAILALVQTTNDNFDFTAGLISAGTLSKYGIINVMDYGAKGDGVVDDTAAIQAAIDSVPDEIGGILFFPALTYKRGTINISNKKNLKIVGYGSKHILTGENATIGLIGTIENLTIEGLEIQGDGAVESKHAGVSCVSGQKLINVKTLNNYIHDVIIGISYNSDLSGTIVGGEISGNRIENVFGTAAGQGYGIHAANIDVSENVGLLIVDNEITKAYRHSIYLARGSGYNVSRNRIYDHRKNASDTVNPRAALNISRCSNVVADGNLISNPYTCALMITPGDAGFPAKNIIVTNNVIIHPKTLSGFCIGYIDPALGDVIDGALLKNNTVITDIDVPPLTIYYGKNILVEGNVFVNTFGRTIILRAEGDTAGTATYSNHWVIRGNSLTGTTAYRLVGLATSIVDLDLIDNKLTLSGNIFSQSVAISNPNIVLEGHGSTGVSFTGGASFLGKVISKLSVSNGASGSFTTNDGKTVTVTNGIITNVV